MTVWEILGIDPSDDERAIKKAYAKGLKKHHPEEDPEGYQRLREAYDAALNQAKHGITFPQPDEYDEYDEYDEETENDWNPQFVETAEDTIVHPVEGFMQEVQKLYDDFFARLDLEKWETLLQSDIVWDMQYSEPLQDRLIDFLTAHTFLPHSVWNLLEQTFQWTERKEEMTDWYGETTVQLLFEHINGSRQMSYDHFLPEAEVDYEQYVRYRKDAQDALIENDLERAGQAIDQAFQLYSHDPELFHLKGIFLLRMDDDEGAFAAFEQKLGISPQDIDGLLYRAQLYYRKEKYMEAIRDCEQVLDQQPEHMEALFIIVKCYMALNDEVTAHHWIERALKTYEERPEFYPYRAKVFNLKTRKVEPPKLDAKTKWRSNLIKCLYFLILFLRRTGFYVLFFLIVLLSPVPFEYTLLLLIPVLWEIWKIVRAY